MTAPMGEKIEALNTLEQMCREVWMAHADPHEADYNECEKAECSWCEKTKAAIAFLREQAPRADLPRYGLQWNGPKEFVATPMADGYWTPWHLAVGQESLILDPPPHAAAAPEEGKKILTVGDPPAASTTAACASRSTSGSSSGWKPEILAYGVMSDDGAYMIRFDTETEAEEYSLTRKREVHKLVSGKDLSRVLAMEQTKP